MSHMDLSQNGSTVDANVHEWYWKVLCLFPQPWAANRASFTLFDTWPKWTTRSKMGKVSMEKFKKLSTNDGRCPIDQHSYYILSCWVQVVSLLNQMLSFLSVVDGQPYIPQVVDHIPIYRPGWWPFGRVSPMFRRTHIFIYFRFCIW